jgi:YhcN/YlaJ family sporulation lipoprotein
MKSSKSIIILFITILVGVSLIAGGCNNSYAKKPIPNSMPSNPSPDNGGGTQTAEPVIPDTNTLTPTPSMDVANNSAIEAGRVSGVKKAVAVANNNIIYIGLTLNDDVDKTKIPAIQKEVVNRVQHIYSGYKAITTTDMSTIATITKVAEGVNQGKPTADFKQELDMIAANMPR